MKIEFKRVGMNVRITILTGESEMKEKAIDRRMACATVDIEICKKIEKKFRRSADESLSSVYARALEELSRDVVLTAQEYAEIDEEIERNRKARQAKRENENKNNNRK